MADGALKPGKKKYGRFWGWVNRLRFGMSRGEMGKKNPKHKVTREGENKKLTVKNCQREKRLFASRSKPGDKKKKGNKGHPTGKETAVKENLRLRGRHIFKE